MALTPDQQAQLAQLEAERDAPEPRTETGIKGVLHTLIDVAAGRVAHLPDEAWDALHRQAEDHDAETVPPLEETGQEPAE